MTVPEIDTLCWSSAAYSRRVARLAAGEAVTQPDKELARMQEWPLRSYLELRALPACVRSARMHAKNILREWHIRALTDTVELLVSEIITNAVHASAGPAGGRNGEVAADDAATLLFWLAADGERALIQVWDCCEGKPQRRESAISAESGRGLLLVEALSDEWGSYVPSGWAGKVVWALVADQPGRGRCHGTSHVASV